MQSTYTVNHQPEDQLDTYRARMQWDDSPVLASIVCALEAGYSEITLLMREGWEMGFPGKDPRPCQHPEFTSAIVGLAAGTALLVGLFVVWQIWFLFFIEGVEHFVFGAFLLAVIALCALGFTTAIWMWSLFQLSKINDKAFSENGLSITGTHLFLKQNLPSDVAQKVQKARECGVFDTILTYAPAQAFNTVFLGDPFILGKIGHQYFLVAQFNLGEDRGMV